MFVVFTDLDGTLLDGNYSFEGARSALELLQARGIPCVLVTSKTRAETVFWRRALHNGDPFIVENGGAAVVSRGYLPLDIPGSIRRGRFDVHEWGLPHSNLVAALEECSRAARCELIGFNQMSPLAISKVCGLTLEQAKLAKRREYDEPFRIVNEARTGALLSEIEARGIHWIAGGRFYHVHGANDKGRAVAAVSSWFRQLHEHVTTIGLGDALNDEPFLNIVDIPVVIRSPNAALLAERIPQALITRKAGVAGWNEVILRLIA